MIQDRNEKDGFADLNLGIISQNLYKSYSMGYLGKELFISGNSMAAVSLYMSSRQVASVLNKIQPNCQVN
ncbi:MAG: hypothetical protein BWY74_02506 [Firmicutes bacterium ADurb.Bin419]|nr:MAG: hypothetical protein BWY74_02506 [Firmicutes bacterium ADurb.Bin419]